MAQFLFVACHDGPVRNVLLASARHLREAGHNITFLFQAGNSAAASWERDDFNKQLQEMNATAFTAVDAHRDFFFDDSLVLTSFSNAFPWNLEVEATRVAHNINIPVYGIEEAFAGRNNPTWKDSLPLLRCLFSTMPYDDFTACPEIVVGPMALERWRGVPVEELASSARAKLGITQNDPVLYFFPAPNRISPTALHILGYLLACYRSHFPENSVLILNRHRREEGDASRILDNGGGFRSGLRYIAERTGLRVFDCSPEYDRFPQNDDRSIIPEFRPKEFLTYQEMLAITAGNGVALTFNGTDGHAVAPYLAKDDILSILWLDPVLGGNLLKSENGMTYYPLKAVMQANNDQALLRCLKTALCRDIPYPYERWSRCKELAKLYPFPEHEPAKLIVDHILKDLAL